MFLSESLSLVEHLATVPDPRSPKGRRHLLTAILSLTVVATLASMKSLEAIAPFGRDHGKALAHALDFTRGTPPNKSCLSKRFRPLDSNALEDAWGRWILGRIQHHGWDALALDGKTMRGSTDNAVVHRLQGVKASSKAAATRRFAAQPKETFPLLFT